MDIKLSNLEYQKDIKPHTFEYKESADKALKKALDNDDLIYLIDYDWHRKCSCGGNLFHNKHKKVTSCLKCHMVYEAPTTSDNIVMLWNTRGARCAKCNGVVFGFSKNNAGQEGWFWWKRWNRYYVCSQCGLVHHWNNYLTHYQTWDDFLRSHTWQSSAHVIMIPITKEDLGG